MIELTESFEEKIPENDQNIFIKYCSF